MPTKPAKHLGDLFLVKLKALYDVEHELVKALPKMAKKASHPELKKGLLDHEKETKVHIERLEQIFRGLEEKPQKVRGDAIRGLIADTAWTMTNAATNEIRDAGIIAAGQYAEHYEMAGYGTAAEWAAELELPEAENLLRATLAEEEAADKKLNNLAMSEVNERAKII